MMLQMFINNMLIDQAEVDFTFCDTVKKRSVTVDDLCAYLYKTNFEHAFIARQEPVFYLVAPSKANAIIDEGCNSEALMNELTMELIDTEKTKKAFDLLWK